MSACIHRMPEELGISDACKAKDGLGANRTTLCEVLFEQRSNVNVSSVAVIFTTDGDCLKSERVIDFEGKGETCLVIFSDYFHHVTKFTGIRHHIYFHVTCTTKHEFQLRCQVQRKNCLSTPFEPVLVSLIARRSRSGRLRSDCEQ